MVVVCGYLEYRPEERDEVVAGLIAVSRRSREDAGCIDYWWAEDLETPGRFRFFECWDSQEHFEAHRNQPYEDEFMNRFVNGRITGADAWTYSSPERSSALGA